MTSRPKKPSVDRTLAAVLKLLSRGKPEERAGAALVLGAIRPSEPAVEKALLRAWRIAAPSSAPYVLDALAKLRTPAAARLLAGLLEEEGWKQEQAVRLLGDYGEAACPAVLAALRKAAPDRRPPYYAVLARSGAPEAASVVSEALGRAGFQAAKTVYRALRAALPDVPKAARRQWSTALIARASSSAAVSNPPAAVAAAKLLRYFRDPRAVGALCALTGPDRPPVVRRSGLQALHATPASRADRAIVIAAVEAVLRDPTSGPELRATAERIRRAR